MVSAVRAAAIRKYLFASDADVYGCTFIHSLIIIN